MTHDRLRTAAGRPWNRTLKSGSTAALAAALLFLCFVAASAALAADGHADAATHAGMDHGDAGHGDVASDDMERSGGEQSAGGHTGADHSEMDSAMDSHDMAEGHDHEAMVKKAQEEIAAALAKSKEEGDAPPDAADLSVTEKLGQYVADGVFKDSHGKTVHLKDIIDVPTILLPVYYTCPSVCNLIQHSFARILPQVTLESGTELKVISISFDETDTPELAAKTKHNYVQAMRADLVKKRGEGESGLTGFNADHWIYLTGSKEEIATVMKSIGFGYKRVEGGFVHPAVIVAVAPDGKIVRYLYGTDFLPFDITMAATEAAQGKVGVSVKRLLSFCFNYDPEGRRYVFDFMRVAGFGIAGFLAIFLAVLLLTGRKKRK